MNQATRFTNVCTRHLRHYLTPKKHVKVFWLEMAAIVVAMNRELVVEGRGFFSTSINLFVMPE